MPSRKAFVLILLLVVMAALLGACGPRVGAGDLATAADAQKLVVDLPAIYIDYDMNGVASIAGNPLTNLNSTVGQDLSRLNIGADWIAFLSGSNIQHIQVLNTAGGLSILVNGEPAPSLSWDGEALMTTVETISAVGGAGVGVLEKALPLITDLGVGAVIRFPVAEGAALIPLKVEGENTAAAKAKAAQAEFLAAVGTPPQIQINVDYAADGAWMVEGMNAEQWTQAVPAPWTQLNLPPDLVQGASAAGIKTVGISSNAQGVFVSVNGKMLPHISWENGEVAHVLNLVKQTGVLDSVFGGNADVAVLLETVQNLLPAVQASDVQMTVNFP